MTASPLWRSGMGTGSAHEVMDAFQLSAKGLLIRGLIQGGGGLSEQSCLEI